MKSKAQIMCVGGSAYLDQGDLHELNQLLESTNIEVVCIEDSKYKASIFDSIRIFLDEPIWGLLISITASLIASELLSALKFIFRKYKNKKEKSFNPSKRQPSHLVFHFKKQGDYGYIDAYISTDFSDELAPKALKILLEVVKDEGVKQSFPCKDFVVEPKNEDEISVISFEDFCKEEADKQRRNSILRQKEELSKEDTEINVQIAKQLKAKPTYKLIQEYVRLKYGFIPKTCWIAHVKELCGILIKKSHNRKLTDKREQLCPPEKIDAIKDAFIYFNMI